MSMTREQATRAMLITELGRLHSELQGLLNASYVLGIIGEDEKLWMRSALYHIQSVRCAVEKDELARQTAENLEGQLQRRIRQAGKERDV